MNHISAALPEKFLKQRNALFDRLREKIPELAGLPNEVLADHGADLLDAADCRTKCRNCESFAGCWREGDAKGRVPKVTATGGTLQISPVTCNPYRNYLAEEQQARLRSLSGMTNDHKAFTFSNYPQDHAARHRNIYKRALELAETYDGVRAKGLYLYGPTGIGKTHLMLAILNRLNQRGITSVFVRADGLLDRLREAIRADEDVDAVLERFATAPALGIDEFAQERFKEFGLESLLKVLNARVQTGKLTIFTSNFHPAEAYERRYSEAPQQIDALRSRLYQLATAARMTGDDWRLMNLDALGPEEE